jgi:hypothetical protein
VTHNRKNGQKQSQPICLWNGLLEDKHRRRIGPAIWLYLELLDKITREDSQGIGWVLGGKPVKAEEFKGKQWTNREHLKRLRKFGYISTRRTPYGFVIGVTNSLKLRFGRGGEKPNSGVGESTNSLGKNQEESWGNPLQRVGEKPNYKEDKAVDKAKSSVRLPAAMFWKELGIAPESLPNAIRKLCEDLYAKKGDQSPIDYLSSCMDAIQLMGWRIPPQLAQAKTVLKANGTDH